MGKKWYTEKYVDLFNEEANEYIYSRIEEALKKNNGLIISKFGTIELANFITLHYRNKFSFKVWFDAMFGRVSIFPSHSFKYLCNNAGFSK